MVWKIKNMKRFWDERNQPTFDPVSKQPTSSKEEASSSFPKGHLCHHFSIAEIWSATQGFNESLIIGRGGCGNAYKGTINNGRTFVVIKRWVSTYVEHTREFQNVLELVSMLRHRSIVHLIGYCDDDKEMITVHEYMSNGTLGDHLYNQRTPLSWAQRLKICIDAAHALDYLHNGTSGQAVIHCDVKSSNILLDNQWAAKITGFEFSKVIPIDSPHVSTSIVGTFGYLDPEYYVTGIPTMKSDVYSFGVVLLEVLCRRRAWDMIAGEGRYDIVGWAEDYLRKGELEQIIDPDLRGQISLKCLNNYARIVEGCLRRHGDARITMAEVVVGLESVLALQERTNNSIPGMSITTSDRRLQKYFFSYRQGSGGSSFRKAVNAKSHQHKGDHGYMSEPDAKSEESYRPEEFYPASEPNRTDSLYYLMQLDYIQEADVLMRMKDFLHLLWFYPVKKEAEVNFGFLVDKISSLKEYIRKSQDFPRDENYLMEIQTLLLDIEEHLDDAAFDMVAYLPEVLVQNRSGSVGFENLATGANSGQIPYASFWSHIPEIHASAIASASDRASRCIKDLKVKKLGILGSGAKEIAETLKDTPEVRRAFDMVLFVHVKDHSFGQLMINIEEEIRLWKKRSLETGNKINALDQSLSCLLFVDCSDNLFDLYELEFHLSEWFRTVQMVMTSRAWDAYRLVDLEIRIQDHLLPWILFSTNVDLATVGRYSSIQQMAIHLVEKCHGHLLAIILLAKALRGIVDVSAWELALQELSSQQELPSSQLGVTSDVMVRVLRFIWSRMEPLSQRCIIQFALHTIGAEFEKSSLIYSWIRDGLVKGEKEGELVFEDLIGSFLLERVGKIFVRMRDETRVILVAYFVPRAYGLYLKQDGSESNKMPNVEEWDAREIHLSDNILSELPDKPNCPILVNLFLHSNQDLMDIPITFFDHMPSLQVLDFSNTSIKHLPSSISKLTNLRQLFLRDCDLLMELPPEIGALRNLKVFDAEGTQLIYLPEQFGSLTKLKCLKFSSYNCADRYKQSKQIMQIIPAGLSKLVRLKELSICVDSYCEWWEDEAKLVIDVLPKLRNLESLKLYFPTTGLLHMFMEQLNWEGVPIYPYLSNFSFIVGRVQQRLITRVPLDLDKMFLQLPKCLKYTNGEGHTEAITTALKHVHALFLDRHWTIPSLSTFGAAQMEKLKFCLLTECNEMLEIFNGSYFYEVGGNENAGSSTRPVLASLQYLAIHYMKSLSCIWKGPIHSGCLVNLKSLAMHTCPELRSILTHGLLDNLTSLEYLIVEDCTKIKSIVSSGSYHSTSTRFLPRLKKISLLYLPELVSISCGISIAPKLESLVIYDCSNLEKLSNMEISDDILEIKGENEWWDALKWCEPEWTSGRPDYLANVFIPLGTEGDIMDELADAVNFLPHLGD